MSMEHFENVISALDCLIDTERKRHITGGVFLSVAMLFAGLAITVMTSKNKEEKEDD